MIIKNPDYVSLCFNLLMPGSYLWASPIFQLFDFLTIDILCITGNFGHFFGVLTCDFLLKLSQPGTGLFFVYLKIFPETLVFQEMSINILHAFDLQLPSFKTGARRTRICFVLNISRFFLWIKNEFLLRKSLSPLKGAICRWQLL